MWENGKITLSKLILFGILSLLYPLSCVSTDAGLSLEELFDDVDLVVPAGENHPLDSRMLRHNLILALDPSTFITKSEEAFWENALNRLEEANPLFKVRTSADTDSFRSAYGEETKVVCLKRGTPIEYVFDYFKPCSSSKLAGVDRWFKQCSATSIGWINYSPDILNIYWKSEGINYPNGEIHIGEPKTVWKKASIGHTFILESKNLNASNPGYVHQEFVALGDSINIIGTQNERRKRRDLSQEEGIHLDRRERNRAQRIKRVFTNVGFKRIQVPRKLMGSIRTFWQSNRNNFYLEMFPQVHINWWERETTMVVPPFALKKEWHSAFQPVLEEWSGIDLSPTDLYGIRSYHRGNWLLNHVDRHQTHAVSAIINVEQYGMESDWELEIEDVHGNVHHSALHTGEAMLYESARCMHGRPRPLNGENYTNVFFHYRPKGDGRWWDEDLELNPPGLRPNDIEKKEL